MLCFFSLYFNSLWKCELWITQERMILATLGFLHQGRWLRWVRSILDKQKESRGQAHTGCKMSVWPHSGATQGFQAARLRWHVSATCHGQGSAVTWKWQSWESHGPERCVLTEFSFPSGPATGLCGGAWCTFTGLESGQPSALHARFLGKSDSLVQRRSATGLQPTRLWALGRPQPLGDKKEPPRILSSALM